MHKEKPKKKFDEIYLVLIVVVLILIVYSYTRGPSTSDADRITEMIIDHHEFSFAVNGVIDNEKLEQIKSMDYSQLKKTLDMDSDFCLYIEDGQGNIILAKGASKLEGNGISCG